MHNPRSLLGPILALALLASASPAAAFGLLGTHPTGTWFGTPGFDGSGYHRERHWDFPARPGHRHRGWHGRHRGPGRGNPPFYAMEHRHGGLGWHVHREWWHHRHRERRRHGHVWNDDWEEGAGIALGVLAGLLLLNQFADGGTASGGVGPAASYSPFLDARSQHRQGQAIRNVLDAGGNSVAVWESPANRSGSASGEVRIVRNGRDDFGNPCREYHQKVRIGDRIAQDSRVACRDRNGNWHLR